MLGKVGMEQNNEVPGFTRYLLVPFIIGGLIMTACSGKDTTPIKGSGHTTTSEVTGPCPKPSDSDAISYRLDDGSCGIAIP